MSRSGLRKADLQGLKIVVAGDCILDRYVYGDVTRISPESPVPVLNITRSSDMPGGAGNVLANLKGLGVEARIVSVIGADAEGDTIKNFFGEGQSLLVAGDRPTVLKTRYVGNGQQMLRADREKIESLAGETEAAFIEAILAELKGARALILSDYGKGALTPKVLQAAIQAAKKAGVPVLADPKGGDYGIYRGADVVTPNRKELAEATGYRTETDADMEAATHRLLEASGIGAVVATRSEKGMTVLTGPGREAAHLNTQAREVFDVSGAGDTVIAVLAAGLAAGLDLLAAAAWANRAAGIVVGKAGTAAIAAQELFENDVAGYLGWADARKRVEAWKAQGLKVGFTNGCFDILHAGHVTYLAEAALHCDRLVLGLNHDRSVRILKGPTRPVNDETSRAVVMAGLSSVDAVVLFGAEETGDDNTPVAAISHLRPDIIFKGGDYTEDQLPEAKVVRAYGGDVKIMGVVEGKSTTNIIRKISAA